MAENRDMDAIRLVMEVMADIAFKQYIERLPANLKARYEALDDKAKKAFKQTFEIGWTEGYVEAVKGFTKFEEAKK